MECFERLYKLPGGKSFFLQLPGRITAVQMDSGSGKSYVASNIKRRKINFHTDYRDVIVIDSEDSAERFLVSEFSNKVIIIDEYDYLSMCYPSVKQKILDLLDDNRFLIYARCYTGLPIRPTDYAEMVYDNDLNQFKLHYPLLMTLKK